MCVAILLAANKQLIFHVWSQQSVCVASFLNPPLMRLRLEGVMTRNSWWLPRLNPPFPPNLKGSASKPHPPHSCWTLKDVLSPQIISLCEACSAACSVV